MAEILSRNQEDSDTLERKANVRRLYEDHANEIHRYVHRRCGDRSLAEDVTHDVFMRLAHLDDLSAVTVGWLKRTARNRMIDIIRRKDSYDKKLGLLGCSESARTKQTDATDRLLVEHALAELTPLHRMVLMLRFVDGHSPTELAEILGRSLKGADAVTLRAKAALRAQLELNDV